MITGKILLLALLCFAHIRSLQGCIHDDLDIPIEINEVEEEQLFDTNEHQRVLATTWGPLKIRADYSALKGATTSVKSYIQNKLIPAALDYFAAALQVPQNGKLILAKSRTKLCDITVPSLYRTSGVNEDLVLFITGSKSSGSYLAWAKPCLLSGTNNRPIFGQVHFNYNGLVAPTDVEFESDLMVTLHEITHVLGFSKALFSYFPTKSTVGKKVVNGNTISYVNVPALTTKLRKHFGCTTLPGAYLENQGSDASAGSHFERRVFMNEYMTASAIKDARISEFTLTLLAGSGWYKANYAMAEPITWGKGKGCKFLDTPCMSKSTRRPNFDGFCSTLQAKGCTYDGRSGGYCGTTVTRTAKTLDSDYNYFGGNKVVLDGFADNCPYVRAYNNIDCENPDDEDRETISGESYGTGSKCFMGNLYPRAALKSKTPYCFKYKCAKQKTGKYFLNVIVGKTTGVCKAKGTLKISGYAGSIDCPDPNTYCKTIGVPFCKRGCLGRGTCLSTGVCKCKAGYKGVDCGLKTTTRKLEGNEDPVFDDNITPDYIEEPEDNFEDEYEDYEDGDDINHDEYEFIAAAEEEIEVNEEGEESEQ